jgi:hypothetical protein
MSDSILTSTKKVLGIAEDYEVFDPDILMHINSILAVVRQLGVGPTGGFPSVQDADTVWTDFYGDDPDYDLIRTYVFLRVRILFDPPATSFLLDALTQQYKELEWRINMKREVDLAARPTLPDPWSPPLVTTPPESHHWWD